MKKLLSNTQLSQLSMGMSNDYLEAIDYNSTFVRIGSKIFGERSQLILILISFLINFANTKKSFFLIAIQPAVGL